MRKLLFLIILLPAMAWGQNTTTLPSGTTSTTLQARVLGTDSLRSFYIASGQSYNQWYTATQINKLFRTSGSLFNKHADSLFARAVDLYNNQTVGGNKTYTGNNIYSGTQDYNNTFNINNSANLNGVFYWTTGRIDPGNGYIHMWDWFLEAKRIDAVVQRFYYNYGTGGHDDIKYDKTARTFNLVYSDARGSGRILTTLDTASTGGAISGNYITKTDTTVLARKTAVAAAYKLKSDSTVSTGYQTVGNLFGRTDTRYYTKTQDDTRFVALSGSTSTGRQTIQLTTEQLRLAYDVSNYASFTVSSAGTLLIAPSNGQTNLGTGILFGSDYRNTATSSNSRLQLATTGLIATRNVADANPALLVTQANASSTGNILSLANNVGNVFTVSQAGLITLGTVTTQTSGDNSTKIASTAYVDRVKYLRLTASGTGAATTISIAHGLTGVTATSIANVTPITSAASGTFYITTDATNINIVYAVAPVTGTNNLSYNIIIKP